jgi:Fe-S-cluster-containing dehydrogenase component
MERAVSRRQFFQIGAAATAAGVATATAKHTGAATSATSLGMLIDLTKCDGCPDRDTPRCVLACREENSHKFPEPKHPIPDNWPTGTHEDWSGKRHLTGTLTPYNWTFVQKVTVDHQGKKETVHIPRHCMHCDIPPCASLCPYSAMVKQSEGSVTVNPNVCLGGAKCRTVCPWHIPQRQAGVGLYMAWQPVPAGGGVMYKCDFCIDRIREGMKPACVEACDRDAIQFGPKAKMKAKAEALAKEIGGYTYGIRENGGTSVFYVSKVPFEKINDALVAKKERFLMPVDVKNPLEEPSRMAEAVVLAPVAAGLGALAAAFETTWKLTRREAAELAELDSRPDSPEKSGTDKEAIR